MNYLTADGAILERLESIMESVEVRDPSGKVLGHFTPAVSIEELARYEEAKKLFDPTEVKRRKEAEHGCGYTIEQVLEHLKSLETSG
jgi:hypothetical protein